MATGSPADDGAQIEPDGRPPGEAPLARSLARLAEQAARSAPHCCGALATLSMPSGSGGLDDAGDPALGVTHPDLTPLVTVQFESGEGPIPAALATGRPVSCPDLLRDRRWDGYRAHALDAGLRSTTTLPYRRAGVVLTLTVCSFRPHGTAENPENSPADPGNPGTASYTDLLGDLAASVLVRDLRYRAALDEVEQLDTALRSRPVVDRACGIIMVVTGCGPDQAFAVLRRVSQRANRKLHDVAEGVVRTRGRGVERELRQLGQMP